MLTKIDLKQISSIVTKESEKTRKEFRKEFKNINKKLDKSIDFLDRDYIKLQSPSSYIVV